MMSSSTAECVEAELCGILTTALQFRCHKLNTMINSYSARELQNIFPQLVDSIFNSRNGHGWGLRSTTQSSNEFELLHEFFQPLGPIFRLCYKLLDDHVKFALPISYLPQLLKTRLMMGDDLPNFYKDILTQNACGLMLQLNAFDYYIFQFALHLCNDSPCPEYAESFNNQSFSVYQALFCDYLCHFLPSDGNSIVLPHLAVHRERSIKIPTSQTTRLAQTPRLIRISESPPLSPVNTLNNNGCSGFQQHWRTETVLNVFTDIWLCSDLVVEKRNTAGIFVNDSCNIPLPSTDYIKLIRILVKYLHAFALSAKYDPNQNFVELKNGTWKLFQDKFYLFLRQMLNRWPLDHNFILIVEMWLSFIQPWRYDRSRTENRILELDSQCRAFITENLLAYTQIFQQVLSRIERLDLLVFNNCSMLYRVVKVLSRSPIPTILYEIELSLNNPSPFSTPIPSTSNLSPKANNSLQDSCRTLGVHEVIRQRIGKLEGPDFKYQNMFDHSVIYQVTKLLKHMQECIILSKRNVQMLETTLRARKKGFINLIKYFLEMTETSDLEQSIAERKKVPGYLELSSQYLCQIFNLDYEELMRRINEQLQTTLQTFLPNANSSFNTSGYDSLYNAESSLILNCSQIKEHARNLGYMGDPDLLPATSQEIKFLVDALFEFSKSVNMTYQREITGLWYDKRFIGKVARQLLLPPMIAKSYVRSRYDFSSLQSTRLPPRLSLRSFAQIKLLVYVSISLIFGFYTGYPLLLTAFILLIGFCIYILIRATFCDAGILTDEEIALRSSLPRVKVAF